MESWTSRFCVLLVALALSACGSSNNPSEGDKVLSAGASFSYKFQPLVESDAAVSYTAVLEDGSPLPDWLKFDPNTLMFSGTAPQQDSADTVGTLKVQVIASGASGELAKTSYSVRVLAATTAVAEIVNPAEELQEFAPTGMLRWTQATGAVDYEVWAYKDPGLTQLAEFSSALLSRQYQFTKLEGGKTYYVKLYYRVAGVWRSIPAFTIKTTATVLKARLTNPQEELESFGPTGVMRWTTVPGADVYELWIYRDSKLVAFAENSGPVDITQFQIKTLKPGSTYYVQVYARVNGVYRAGDALAVTIAAVVDRTRIINPQEELDAFATNGTLRWTAVTGATEYEVWIFLDPNVAKYHENSGSVTQRSYQARTLQPNSVYYVQVFAKVNGELKAGSPYKITTVSQPTKARLTNQQEEIEAFSTSGTLRWTEVAGADGYQLWVYGNAGQGGVIEWGDSPSRSYQLKRSCSGAIYYVQVFARVNGKWTTGWPTRLDVTQGASPADCVPPVPAVKFTASKDEVVSGESVTLTWSSQFATSCTASDAWSGTKAPSGQEIVGPIAKQSLFTLICTGQSGSSLAQTLVTLAPAFSSIAGSILLTSNTQVDGDVNDPNALFKSNDTAATAQQLPTPVVLGGYVNDPFRGKNGRSYATGDLGDIYKLALKGGQVIELVMPSADPTLPDAQRDDADLLLYNSNQVLVDSSEGITQTEQLLVPADGSYFVVVELYSGAPLYRLSIAQSSVQAAADSVRLSDDFVPGEVVVSLKNGSSAPGARQKVAASLKTSLGLQTIAGDPSREMLMAIPKNASQYLASYKTSVVDEERTGFRTPDEFVIKRETLRYLKTLRSNPSVLAAGPNRILTTAAVPNDPIYALQRWHYELIQLPSAWNVTAGSPSVLVAVVDSGVVAHPDLVANLQGGFDFVTYQTDDGDGLDAVPYDPGCSDFGRDNAHGTHVAGTIVATTDNGTGVAGIAGNARVMPVRVFNGCGKTTTYQIFQGVRYAAGLASDAPIPAPRAADIINLSLGGLGVCDAAYAQLFSEVRGKGVIVVAAAGNSNTSSMFTPASCPNVISVAAVDMLRNRAPYSNYGVGWVDVVAPGGDMSVDRNGDGQSDGVFSTFASGSGSARYATYAALDGTSMAAPHVAGALALMKAVKPSLSPAEVDSLLSQGKLTDDIGVPGPDNLGVGLINAFKAVQAVATSVPPTPAALSVTPSRLDFGEIGAQTEVVLSNAGTGQLTVGGITTSTAQINVVPASVDASGLGRYTIKVSRVGLAPGNYSGWVDFASSAGVRRMSVFLQVVSTPVVPSAGYGYTLLIDPQTLKTVLSVQGAATGARIPYLFSSVPSGEYLVLSGTDLDNDFLICDQGEACGAYPIVSRLTPLKVIGTLAGIDFAAGFDVSLESSSQNVEGGAGIEANVSRGFARKP